MQWNANEKAWAQKHGVTLGQKQVGGLANLDAYRKKAGLGPKGGTPSGGNKLQMQPAGKPGGGGLLQGRAGGAQQAFQAGAPTLKKSGLGGMLAGGALGGAGGYFGSQLLAAYGSGALVGGILIGVSMRLMASEAGWAICGEVLGAALLSKSIKSN